MGIDFPCSHVKGIPEKVAIQFPGNSRSGNSRAIRTLLSPYLSAPHEDDAGLGRPEEPAGELHRHIHCCLGADGDGVALRQREVSGVVACDHRLVRQRLGARVRQSEISRKL